MLFPKGDLDIHPKQKKSSINSSILLITILTIIISFPIVAMFNGYIDFKRDRVDTLAKLQETAFIVSQFSGHALYNNDHQNLQKILYTLRSINQFHSLVLHDNNDDLVLSLSNQLEQNSTHLYENTQQIYYKVNNDIYDVGTFTLTYFGNNFYTQFILSLKETGSMIMLVILAVISMQALSIHWLIVLPLNKLSAHLDRSNQRHNFTPLQWHNVHEISQLIETYNKMGFNLHTALRELQEERDTAEQSSKSKSIYLSAMSHDLKSPLTTIIACIDLIKNDAFQRDAGKDEIDHIHNVEVATNKLNQIVERLLTLSALENQRYHLNPVATNIKSFLNKIATENRSHFLQNSLTCQVQSFGQTEFNFDPKAIKEVIKQILDNAIAYTPNGGLIEIGAHATEKNLRIWISDNGIGIEANKIESITHPFKTDSSAFSAMQGGNGLGLAISQGIIDLIGGKLNIDSKPNIGTRIEIIIP